MWADLPSRSFDFLITPICQPFSLWSLGLLLTLGGSPLRLVKIWKVCQFRARDDQIQRGSSNIIGRMPRKMALSPGRTLPSPHFPYTVLFQPLVICYAVGSPGFPLPSPPFSLLPGQRVFGFLFLLLFSQIVLRLLHLPKFSHRGTECNITDDIFLVLPFCCLPPPIPNFLEWASKAAKSRHLTHVPWVGSIPMGKFDVASF